MAAELTRLQSVGLVLLFVLWAALCTVSNKKIMVHLNSNFLFLMQAMATVVMLKASTTCGVLPATVSQVKVTKDGQVSKSIWIAIAYSCNVAFGLFSLHYVSIPVFGALKRLTILSCWIGEYYLFRNSGTLACVLPLAVMVLGTLVAGWHDLEFHFLGYLFGVLSSAGQGIAFVMSKLLDAEKDEEKEACGGDEEGGSKGSGGASGKKKKSLEQVMSVVYTNACVSIALMVAVLSAGGWSGLFDDAAAVFSPSGSGHLAFNFVSILLLNLIIFLDCTLNSPLTHAVAGNLKAAVTSVAGILIFGTKLKPLGLGGVVLNLIGGAWYTWIRYKNRDGANKKDDDSTTELQTVLVGTSPRATSRQQVI